MHSLASCTNLNNLRTNKHDKPTHAITTILNNHPSTRCFTLSHVGIHDTQNPHNIVRPWFLPCTCYEHKRECLVRLRPNILCILGTSHDSSLASFPSPQYKILMMEFTYYNDRFSKEVVEAKLKKYAPLLHTIQTHGWSITLTTLLKVSSTMHHQPTEKPPHPHALDSNPHANYTKYCHYS